MAVLVATSLPRCYQAASRPADGPATPRFLCRRRGVGGAGRGNSGGVGGGRVGEVEEGF